MTRTPVGRVNSLVAGEPAKSERRRDDGGWVAKARWEGEGEEKARESRARITNSDGGGKVAACTMSERETRKLNWQAQVALKPDYPSLVLNYLLAASSMSLASLARSLSLSFSSPHFLFFLLSHETDRNTAAFLFARSALQNCNHRPNEVSLARRTKGTNIRAANRGAGGWAERKIGNASRAERESNRFQELVVSRFTAMRERYESVIFPAWAPLSRTPPLYFGISQSRTPLSGLSPYRLKHDTKNDQVLRIEISRNGWWRFCRNI